MNILRKILLLPPLINFGLGIGLIGCLYFWSIWLLWSMPSMHSSTLVFWAYCFLRGSVNNSRIILSSQKGSFFSSQLIFHGWRDNFWKTDLLAKSSQWSGSNLRSTNGLFNGHPSNFWSHTDRSSWRWQLCWIWMEVYI